LCSLFGGSLATKQTYTFDIANQTAAKQTYTFDIASETATEQTYTFDIASQTASKQTCIFGIGGSLATKQTYTKYQMCKSVCLLLDWQYEMFKFVWSLFD
jgi:hypothetical protein